LRASTEHLSTTYPFGERSSRGVRTLEFVGLACQGNDIVFSFIVEYSSLTDFGPP